MCFSSDLWTNRLLVSLQMLRLPKSVTAVRSAAAQVHLQSYHACFKRLTASRSYASVTDLGNYPNPGAQLHGFTIQRTKHVPELELTAIQLQHIKTGAEYLHVARDDKNNVFSIGFKTNPPDDTGVPHILEHTTLCGSEKSVIESLELCIDLTTLQISCP